MPRARAKPAPPPTTIDLAALSRVLLLPVRHHSPRASAFVAAELDRARPSLVLIEGPSDAGAMIPVLADEQTKPPIAILGYRTDGITQSALWPFADYSPELVALRWAVRNRIDVRFIDLPVGVALATMRATPALEVHGDGDDDPSIEAADQFPTSPDPDVAARLGMRSFDEAWDALIEAPHHSPADVRALLLAYAALIRATAHRDRARDAVMARAICTAGVAPEQIAVVVGAAHASAFVAGEIDLAAADRLPPAVASAVTVIPYSFPRLAEQLGYGAGNRAPRFYQRAHDAGCDLARATLETLVEIGEHLRLRGFAVSLADTLEAWRLAQMLATIRGKHAPALDEAREAAIATLGRGDAGAVDAALASATIGRAVGHVAAKLGPNALTDEFWREVRARRLPATDEAEDFSLVLNDPVQVASSVFLHRLRIADVPYASWLGAGRDADGLAVLTRIREAWTAQWTPATDVALVEQIVLGSSLEEVAGRILDRRLADARTTGACAEVLLDAVITRCEATTARALAACDDRAAVDDDVPSLARAAVALSSLASYGATRADAIASDVVARLLATTFERAVLRAPVASETDAVDELARALRALHEVAMASPVVDRAAWIDAARAIADGARANPRLAGLALGLLYLAGALTDEAVADALALRLSPANPPEVAAEQLAGFVEVNALVVVKSRAVVAALDQFLTAIPDDRLVDVLPVLRRALGALGAVERRYLLDNVIAVRGLGAAAREAAAVVDQKDADALEAMQAELGAALDDLDDLL
ncbi:MAG TPA: DUF5682 family protein [Kofleriaceae bacterium]|nr:DUF5682 family protein [Kofleriaceae bacterium]